MRLNDIGRVLRTNDVQIDSEQVRKKFKQFAISMLWGFLERKPYLSAKTRYEREKRLVTKFANNPDVTTPTLIDCNDEELILVFKTLELTDLVQIFQNPAIHPDDKLQYLQQALIQLQTIHNNEETHGDPYLKNFFRINKEGTLYTCDFEYERTGPDPAVTDILILTANAINAMSQANGSTPKSALRLVRETYGETVFPFDIRDRIFFSLRFAMGSDFFQHFSRKRKVFS